MGNNSLMQYASYLIVISACIDQGDGRWKERDKENIRRDIMIYKKIAEKLEHEIETFYDEYPDGWLSGDNIGRIHYKYLTNLLNRNTDTTQKIENTDKEKNIFPSATSEMNIPKQNSTNKGNGLQLSSEQFVRANASNNKSDWPKFEDILLAIGRKYDWKNDRWIKVKEKPKRVNLSKSNNVIKAKDDKVDFHEKHKFSYRIVKLNRSKSRRNVVVAVSAVR